MDMQVPEWLRSVLAGARLTAILGAAVYAHACGNVIQVLSALAVGSALGAIGYRKGSLSASGAVPSNSIVR